MRELFLRRDGLLWMMFLRRYKAIHAAVEKTLTGALLHLTDALAKPVNKFTATLEPQQDLHGQANPYPAGGGKNKFDIAKMGERTGVTVTDNTFVGTARNFTASGLVTPFSAPTGTVLTVSCTAKSDGVATSGAGFALLFVYSDNTTLRPWYTKNNETSDTYHTGTVTAASDIVGYKFADYNNGTENTWTVKDFQIELGSTATSYAPYSNICPITGYTGANVYRSGADTSNPTTIPITFPDAAGTVYGGTLENQGTDEWTLTVDRGITYLGERTWGYEAPTSVKPIAQFSTSLVNGKQGVSADLISSIYKADTSPVYGRITDFTACTLNSSLYICDSRFTSASDFKSGVQGQTVVYPLATPVTYTLTNQQTMTLLAGENTVWTDCSDDLELTYLARA